MIASLPMYDRAETTAANDRFWQGIRQHLGHGPAALSRSGDPMQDWLDPALVLSQTCSLPFRSGLAPKVTLLGAFDYGVAGVPKGYYQSVVLARLGASRDLSSYENRPVAVNMFSSQSGWAALCDVATTAKTTLRNIKISGAHRASAEMVASGAADLAAVDCVTWEMIKRWDDFANQLEIIAMSAPTPGLPLICGHAENAADLTRAIRMAIADLTPEDRQTLQVQGFIEIPAAAYLALPMPPTGAPTAPLTSPLQ